MSLTTQAFNNFRSIIGSPKHPPAKLIINQDQIKQMQFTDGLMQWVDGNGSSPQPASTPLVEAHQTQKAHLWVVRSDDVVHAPENCVFGNSLESGVIKHTNLTGGSPAYSGGELIFLDDQTIILNGCSGRYGPRTKNELESVAKAFANSGYSVWSMGFDEETNKPSLFVGTYPEWVSP